jgi:tRNA(Ile)-lysidine synthase
MASRLDHRFDEAIARYEMVMRGDAILVAVSGGPDSLALLHLLAARAPVWQLRLGIAHLDHGLRPESAKDADFIRRIAASLAVPLHTERVDVRELQRRWRLSLEEAGRKARYRFFQETADRYGYGKLALAHHADDNAETFLLNLLRGSGRPGLTGIPPVRKGHCIRPLIGATRADILDYLNLHRLTFLTDPTNTDNGFLRNRIRHQLIPLLERDYQPGVQAVLRRSAEVLRDEEAWIESLIQPLLNQVVISRQPGRLTLRATALTGLALAIQRRIVRAGLQLVRDDLHRIAFVHIEAILALAKRTGDGGPLHLPGGVRVRRFGDALEMAPGEGKGGWETAGIVCNDYSYSMARCGALTVIETGDRIALSDIEQDAAINPAAAGPLIAFLDKAEVEFPVIIRNIRPGDRFSPLGAGGTQKLKKFFIDNKVPRDQRRRCPLLISKGRILWVAGYRIDHHVRLTGRTRQVLKAELILADR